jgi:CRISPR-associated protein Cas2
MGVCAHLLKINFIVMKNKLNEYRIMWVMVLFDLPTETKKERHIYAQFRKNLQKDGFAMFQFSIYLRHCSSRENAEVHIRRVKNLLPEKGHIGILTVTDKQFGMMEIFYGQKIKERKNVPQQLEMF